MKEAHGRKTEDGRQLIGAFHAVTGLPSSVRIALHL